MGWNRKAAVSMSISDVIAGIGWLAGNSGAGEISSETRVPSEKMMP
jgi:hypothetical protein